MLLGKYIIGLMFSLLLWGFAIPLSSSFGLRLDWLIALLITGLFVLLRPLGERNTSGNKGLLLFFLFFHATLIASSYQSLIHPSLYSRNDWLSTYAQYALAGGVFVAVLNNRLASTSVLRILKLYVILSVVAALIGIIQFILNMVGVEIAIPFTNPTFDRVGFGYEERLGGLKRATSLFKEPRQFGSYLLTGLALAVASVRFEYSLFESKRKIFICIGVLAFGVIATLSTSTYFLAILIIIFVFGLKGRSVRKKHNADSLTLGILVLILVYITTSVFSDGVFDWLYGRMSVPSFNDILDQVSDTRKPDFYISGWSRYLGNIAVALEAWGSSPLVGVGLNNLINYSYAHGSFFTGSFGIFRMLAEVGIAGVLALFLFFSRLFYILIRARAAVFRSRMDGGGVLLTFGLIFLITALLKTFGTGLYGFSSAFFWFDISLVVVILNTYRVSKHAT